MMVVGIMNNKGVELLWQHYEKMFIIYAVRLMARAERLQKQMHSTAVFVNC